MDKTTKISRFKSLATRILIIIIAGVTIPLVALGVFGVITNYTTQSRQVRDLQQEEAKNAAVTIDAYLAQLENEMEMAAQMWVRRGDESGKTLLGELQAYDVGFGTLALIDEMGQEIVKVSRYDLITANDLEDRADSPEFLTAQQGERYLGPVTISDYGEPFVTLAIPIRNQTNTVAGVLAAEVSLKYMWDIINRLDIGSASQAYVVDDQGKLIAHSDPSLVLRQPDLNGIEGVRRALQGQAVTTAYTGLEGQDVIGNYQPLQQADWFVLVETLSEEALADVYWTTEVSIFIIVVALALAILLGWYMTRIMVKPLQHLQEDAAIIGGGNLAHRIDIRTEDEVAAVATAFNDMTIQLQQTLEGLEDRVADRTRRLEIVATLGEQLNAILNVDELLREVVDQIKQNFGYYHTHIYLLDDAGKNLMVAAGTGSAGKHMMAEGHSISVSASASLVARAARSGEIVTVGNVQEAENWLPNPLLPDTRSEMAVPIILDKKVVGVLDVQEDKVTGLDESDANLLRSLANQVAVAIRNAKLFAEVGATLNELREAQKKYVEESWQKSKILGNVRHLYASPNVNITEDEQLHLVDDARKLAQAQQRLMIVESEYDRDRQSLVAPINLRDKTIGVLKIQTKDNNQKTWDEDDMAMIEAVVDQVAQTAENLRLFEDTRGRASREQIIRQITEKMRTATNLEELIQTTANELGQQLNAGHVVLDLGLTTDENI